MALIAEGSDTTTTEAFRSALRGGLGRAQRLARELGAEVATELLIEALHQGEVPDGPGTADWLLDLAAECRAETLLSRLLRTEESLAGDEASEEARSVRDIGLIARLAADGDEGARSALYRHFVRQLDDSGTQPIMALDGIQGFLFVVETLGQCLLSREDFQLDLSVYRDACRRLGRDRVESKLERRAARSKYAAAFLEEIRTCGAAGADLAVSDGPACDLDLITPAAATLEAALANPAEALWSEENGSRRAGLLQGLGIKKALDDDILRELLMDAHGSVRAVARRFFRGALELKRRDCEERQPGEGAGRFLSIECFHGAEGAPFELTELFSALRAESDWAEGEPARRGPFRAENLDVMHLRVRQARDLRVTLVDWLTDDPFNPVPIPEIIELIELGNAQLEGSTRSYALLAPRQADEAVAWESYSEWWLVNEEAREVRIVRFGTRP
jgi:hypothetical protein